MSPTENGLMRNDDSNSHSSCCVTKSENSSRLGRKGDPRMHRATAARLANPGLSLIEALRIGGFDYPQDVYEDSYKLPGDTVSLGQRKNQLSRRCRMAKKPYDSKKEGSKRKSMPHAARTQAQQQVLYMENQGGEADPMDQEYAQGGGRQRMARDHPDYYPIIVPPSHVPLADALSNQAQPATLDHAATSVLPSSASMANNANALVESLSHPLPSGVAVASLNATAASVGLTLEQMAVALSSTNNLAKVLSDHQVIPDVKQELALNLFQTECSSLYQRCMLLAGYSIQEAQATSSAYKEFANKAWSAEGERLEKNGGDQVGPSASTRTEPSPQQDASQDAAAAKKSAHEHSEGNSAKCGGPNKACVQGRHVHRLNGKCGHQAIVHQPDGAPPHVDFVVNGKVECYEGISPPAGPCAMWPSRYNCDQLSCPSDSGDHNLACECENECTVRSHDDPKEYELSEIDFNDREWDQDLFQNNNGTENSLAGLMQLGSEDSNKKSTV